MKYLWLTLKHKWFVFLAGLQIGAPLHRLLLHDLSKMQWWTETRHYNRQFFGPADDPRGFIRCWLHHQNSNPHHWEYWIPRTGHNRCDPPYPDDEPIEMPHGYVLEMIADWLGAGRAYTGKWPGADWPWLRQNIKKIRLHRETRMFIWQILNAKGFTITWQDMIPQKPIKYVERGVEELRGTAKRLEGLSSIPEPKRIAPVKNLHPDWLNGATNLADGPVTTSHDKYELLTVKEAKAKYPDMAGLIEDAAMIHLSRPKEELKLGWMKRVFIHGEHGRNIELDMSDEITAKAEKHHD